jgi:hypothetical protein
MATPTESQLMADLIEDLGNRFDVEVLELEDTDLGITAHLRVRSPGSTEQHASASVSPRHLRVVPAGPFD